MRVRRTRRCTPVEMEGSDEEFEELECVDDEDSEDSEGGLVALLEDGSDAIVLAVCGVCRMNFVA